MSETESTTFTLPPESLSRDLVLRVTGDLESVGCVRRAGPPVVVWSTPSHPDQWAAWDEAARTPEEVEASYARIDAAAILSAHTQAFLSLARAGQAAEFKDLALALGVKPSALEGMWTGTRTRLGLP